MDFSRYLGSYMAEFRIDGGKEAWEKFGNDRINKGLGMTPEQFTYWLQGFIELNNGQLPTQEQWGQIEAHLKTVFHKVTPDSIFNPNQQFPNNVVC